jgi:RNA polymerase primary sigma factor
MRQLKITRKITNRESLAVDKYLQDIAKQKLLTVREEVDLARKVKMGDVVALKKLVSSNTLFVVSVAKQYQGKGLSLSDLINQGNLGLIKAAYRFDETRGFKFISYAVWWIRQSILQGIYEFGSSIRLPLNQTGVLSKIRKNNAIFEQIHDREPTIEELADMSNLDIDKIKLAQLNSHKVFSFDNIIYSENENSETSFIDRLADTNSQAPDEFLQNESVQKDVQSALRILDERERAVLGMFYGFGGQPSKTLDEIGEKFNLTRERTRQIKEKAIKKLRQSSKIKLLKKHLG